MLDILLAIILGIVLGAIVGFVPSFHPNNIIPFIFALSGLMNPLPLVLMLVSCATVHSFISFIPSVFLGVPEESTVLSVLPGHRMVMEGRGYEAVRLSVIGGLGCIGFVIITLPVFALIIPNLYPILRTQMHLILIAVVCYMIAIEKSNKSRIFSLTVFFMAGAVGYMSLNYMSDAMIMPLLMGFFGLPTLFMSLRTRTKFPEKFSFEYEKLSKKFLISSISLGSFAGIIAGLLPGLGSSQANVLAQEFSEKTNENKSFIISSGSIAMSDLIYSLVALWLIGNPRSGIADAAGKLITVDFYTTLILVAAIAICTGIGAYITLKSTKTVIKYMKKINYAKLCLLVMVFLIAFCFVMCGIQGIAVLAVSSAIGIFANFAGVRRSHAMGCLMLPTILFFAGF